MRITAQPKNPSYNGTDNVGLRRFFSGRAIDHLERIVGTAGNNRRGDTPVQPRDGPASSQRTLLNAVIRLSGTHFLDVLARVDHPS